MTTGHRHLDWLPVAGLLLLAIMPVGDAAFDAAKVPLSLDLDLIQHYSREAFTRRAFAAGVLPVWNPYEFCGFPALADPQTGVFYPPSVLLRVLPLPLFLTWTVVLHLWICGVGTYLLCRAVGIRRWVAWLRSASRSSPDFWCPHSTRCVFRQRAGERRLTSGCCLRWSPRRRSRRARIGGPVASLPSGDWQSRVCDRRLKCGMCRPACMPEPH